MSVAEKRHCIEPEHPRLSVARQCELIGLSRSSYYRHDEVGMESEENLVLMKDRRNKRTILMTAKYRVTWQCLPAVREPREREALPSRV